MCHDANKSAMDLFTSESTEYLLHNYVKNSKSLAIMVLSDFRINHRQRIKAIFARDSVSLFEVEPHAVPKIILLPVNRLLFA